MHTILLFITYLTNLNVTEFGLKKKIPSHFSIIITQYHVLYITYLVHNWTNQIKRSMVRMKGRSGEMSISCTARKIVVRKAKKRMAMRYSIVMTMTKGSSSNISIMWTTSSKAREKPVHSTPLHWAMRIPMPLYSNTNTGMHSRATPALLT